MQVLTFGRSLVSTSRFTLATFFPSSSRPVKEKTRAIREYKDTVQTSVSAPPPAVKKESLTLDEKEAEDEQESFQLFCLSAKTSQDNHLP